MRVRALALGAALLVACAVHGQQQFAALQKGIQPEKLYHFGDLDNVNVLNGNLVIRIPIGPVYPLDGGLSYQLTLSYNSKVWDLTAGTTGTKASPTKRSNAGLGWVVSMGRYFPATEPENATTDYLYESTDGGDHMFNPDERTDDGSNLRRREIANSVPPAVEIDFPDGVTKRFEKPGATWNLTQVLALRRRLATQADTVSISYGTGPQTACESPLTTSWWVIGDSEDRFQYVCFRTLEVNDVARPMVERIVVRGPAVAPGGPATQAVYQFHYVGGADDQVIVPRPSEDTTNDEPGWATSHEVPFLTGVTLPDGSQFGFSYLGADLQPRPELRAMTLPTGGQVRYEYGVYQIPAFDLCQNAGLGFGVGVKSTGVTKRTILPAVGSSSPQHVWEYLPELRQLGPSSQAYQSQLICPPGPNDPSGTPLPITMYDELVVTVTDPLGGKTKNHFSVWVEDAQRQPTTSPAGFRFENYTYPYGAYDAQQDRHLSQEVVEATGALKRSVYVRHHRDDPTDYRKGHRLMSQRTFYHDGDTPATSDGTFCARAGAPLRCVGSDSSDWDGYGHFRIMTSGGNYKTGGDSRTVTTTWNMSGGVPRTITNNDTPWILNTYESVTAEEAGQKAVSEYCFHLDTGFLLRKRTLKRLDGVRDGRDLISSFTMGTDGNVTSEEHYGGDTASLPNASLCGLNPGTASYKINHTYKDGFQPVRRSEYDPSPGFRSVDQDLDPHTWLIISERDTAGVTTNAVYDNMGRLSVIKPGGRAWTTFGYTAASGTQPAKVTVTQYQNGQTTGTPLGSVVHAFDGYGRPVRTEQSMPDGVTSRRETAYDALGRRATVSEFGNAQGALPVTSFTYDFAGRVKTVTAPDNSVTSYDYVGDRQKVTKTKMALPPSGTDTEVQRTETYDAFGRLARVAENSGPTTAAAPTGGIVATDYGYDAADRLTSVRMQAVDGLIQQRLFDYDGRGLLLWESHPESAMTAYTYDARGHVLTKTQSAANSPYDLTFEYDHLERLLKVRGRNPLYPSGSEPQFRVMKEFTYATTNDGTDLRRGRLLTAIRHNYGLNPNGASYLDGKYTVTETYRYDAAGRRVYRTTHVAMPAGETEFTQETQYNDLDLPILQKYPKCPFCALPANADVNLTSVYDNGRLESLYEAFGSTSSYVTNTTYWPNGLWKDRYHSNSMIDHQEVASSGNGMPRPSSIRAEPYLACTPPVITTHPVGGSYGGPPGVQLSVAASGSGLTYQWFKGSSGEHEAIIGQTSTTITVSPSATERYFVEVTNTCKTVRSAVAVVSVNECVNPAILHTQQIKKVDGTVELTLTKWDGSDPMTFRWYRTADNVEIGTGTKLVVSGLTATAKYHVIASNTCATATSRRDFTVEVPLPITSTQLQATASGSQVTVTWPASAGAAHYILERRQNGSPWQTHATIDAPATSFVENGLPADTTYAYRVFARDSNDISASLYSNADVATVGTLLNVVPFAASSAGDANEVLRAVNLVRAVSGWPPLSWSNILTASHPMPSLGVVISAAHLMSCRARMNEALQALGVPVSGYTDADLKGKSIAAIHVNEVVNRAK